MQVTVIRANFTRTSVTDTSVTRQSNSIPTTLLLKAPKEVFTSNNVIEVPGIELATSCRRQTRWPVGQWECSDHWLVIQAEVISMEIEWRAVRFRDLLYLPTLDPEGSFFLSHSFVRFGNAYGGFTSWSLCDRELSGRFLKPSSNFY